MKRAERVAAVGKMQVRFAGRRICRAPQQGKRKIDQARRQTWGEMNPVTRKPENSKAYNRNKARNWKREYHEPIPGVFMNDDYSDSTSTY